jgi:hypothetical protein
MLVSNHLYYRSLSKCWTNIKTTQSVLSFCKLGRFTNVTFFIHCSKKVWLAEKNEYINSIGSKISTSRSYEMQHMLMVIREPLLKGRLSTIDLHL